MIVFYRRSDLPPVLRDVCITDMQVRRHRIGKVLRLPVVEHGRKLADLV